MTKRLLPFLFAFSCQVALAQTPTAAPAAENEVSRLIKEREKLVREYEEANAQRNSLFGNKPSKKDLQEVVDALKGIIRKDTEVVRAVQASTLRQTAAVVAENQQAKQQVTVATTDQSSVRQRFYDLQNQIQNLEQREKQREKKLQEAQAAAKEAEEARTSREMIALGLAVLSVALLVYVFRLRQRLSAVPSRRGL
jgi:chromosome segregation ATPase